MRKRVFAWILAALLCVGLALPVCAGELVVLDENHSHLVDEADLLDSREERDLEQLLDRLTQELGCEIGVVTVDSLGGKTAMEFADDYYDYNGFGVGTDRSGVLLLVSMEQRDYYITTRGYCTEQFWDSDFYDIEDAFLSELSAGRYADAFQNYAYAAQRVITDIRNGRNEGTGDGDSSGGSIVVGLFVGLLTALVGTSYMKGQLKSVGRQRAAGNYVVDGSMNLTDSREIFLYRNVARTPRPRDNDTRSGGHSSSIHVSSSGASHSGHGGKF